MSADPKFKSDDAPLTTIYTGLYDINFDAPLKSIADVLYGISEATELHFLYDDPAKPTASTKLKHKLKIVPSKLQTFKEKSFQKSGKKFGFVEFHVRSGEEQQQQQQQQQQENDEGQQEKTTQTQRADEISTLFNKNLAATLDHLHKQIDVVLNSLSSAKNLGVKLRRLPESVKQHIEEAKIVTASKDPIKMLAMLAAKCQRFNHNNNCSSSTSSSTVANIPESEKNVTFFFIDDLPVSDLLFLREELPVTFPKTATAESIEKFFVDNLGNSADGFFCLAKKDEGDDNEGAEGAKKGSSIEEAMMAKEKKEEDDEDDQE